MDKKRQEITFRHTKKVYIFDAMLSIFFIGFVTGILHLIEYLSGSLTVGDKYVKVKTGFLSNDEKEIPYTKINSVSVKQDIIGKILNYGSVIIYTGNDVSGIAFSNLDNPSEVKSLILKRI